MPCLLGCLALSAPRLVLFLVWLFGGNWLAYAYTTNFWPFVGWLFMPLTTLAYAGAMHLGEKQWSPLGVALVVTAVLFDVGLLGTGERQRRRRGGGGGPRGGSSGGGGSAGGGGREIVVEGRRVG